jgi:hypothetical protein
MSRPVVALCLSMLLIVSAVPVLADDTESGADGGQIVPVESKAIRMTFEQVDIDVLWAKPSNPEGHTAMRVSAVFELTNESDEAQSITVAFPNGNYDDDFIRTVDGRPVEVDKHDGPLGYTSKIDFAPRQVRHVGVRYTGYTEISSGGYDSSSSWFYVLKTGANWKGTIGRAIISMHFPEDMPPPGKGPFNFDAVKLTPGDCWRDEKSRTATWVFENFEPKEDIRVEWTTGMAVIASNPFQLKSRKEAAALLMEQGHVHAYNTYSCDSDRWMWSEAGTFSRALQAFAAIREFYPESAEAKRVDYEMGCALSHHWVGNNTPDNLSYNPFVLNARMAVKYFTAALKKPLEPRERVEALTELFILCSAEAPDAAKARSALEQLAKMKWIPGVDRALFKVGAVSPQQAIDLLGSLTDAQLGSGRRDSLRSDLELMLKTYPYGLAGVRPPEPPPVQTAKE